MLNDKNRTKKAQNIIIRPRKIINIDNKTKFFRKEENVAHLPHHTEKVVRCHLCTWLENLASSADFTRFGSCRLLLDILRTFSETLEQLDRCQNMA